MIEAGNTLDAFISRLNDSKILSKNLSIYQEFSDAYNLSSYSIYQVEKIFTSSTWTCEYNIGTYRFTVKALNINVLTRAFNDIRIQYTFKSITTCRWNWSRRVFAQISLRHAIKRGHH